MSPGTLRAAVVVDVRGLTLKTPLPFAGHVVGGHPPLCRVEMITRLDNSQAPAGKRVPAAQLAVPVEAAHPDLLVGWI